MSDGLEEIREILEKNNSEETLNRLREEIREKNDADAPEFFRLENYDEAIIPTRATYASAGYDFYAFRQYIIQPYMSEMVATGIKAKIPSNMVLLLFIRSSLSDKLRLDNSVGVVDADYYNNRDNEGHIMGLIRNESKSPVTIHEGMRFMQGVFVEYHTAKNDIVMNSDRIGGFGSTGKR